MARSVLASKTRFCLKRTLPLDPKNAKRIRHGCLNFVLQRFWGETLASTNSIREKLTKLLNLTTSDNDGEALTAIRMANNIVKKNGLSWECLLDELEQPYRPPHTQSAEGEPVHHYSVDHEAFEEMITYVRNNAWPGFDFTFIDSLVHNYEHWGQLTWKQARGLRKAYDTIKEHAARRS